MTASDVRRYIELLRDERAAAMTEGLDAVAAYMDDLEDEIALARETYVAVAVTEIATLRGELWGRQLG
jgi:hypothetical protein